MSENCGGHIHIGADYLTTEESWKNLIEIWANTEKILYIISNKAGELPRKGVPRYASPISSKVEEMLKSGALDLQDDTDLKSLLKSLQGNNRYYGINFQNIGEAKNTIEFRLANGTIDADTWIQNINLFGGIVRSAEELAKIQTKSEGDRTQEEQEMLMFFEQIKNSEITDEDKLNALLSIVIPEEYRGIYIERYKINSPKLDENHEIKRAITEKVAKSPIDIKKIGKKVFVGEEGITGQDYSQAVQIIEKDLQRNNPENIKE